MKSRAVLFLSLYCHYNTCTDAFLARQRVVASTTALSSAASSAVVASPFSSSSVKRRTVPSSEGVTILAPMGNGTFGGVHRARNEATGTPYVAKCARAAAAHDDLRAKEHAIQYLEIEAYVNSKLCPLPEDAHTGAAHGGARHVAPYVGERTIDGTKYLLWEASGECTLEDYIEMKNGTDRLAVDLGVTTVEDVAAIGEDGGGVRRLHSELAVEVLRQMLEGIAYCHSRGIVHRDIKPANILVDPATHTLRLIDFGSACCMNSWSANKLGFKGGGKGPRSILYCAPEEFVNEQHPYAFDMYGIGVAWLRTVLSDDRYEKEEGRASATDEKSGRTGLADEEDLFRWRLAVRDFGHDLAAWEEYATLHDRLPRGWNALFGSSRQGIRALRLLSDLMSFSPARRTSAAEALVGPYLNSGCDADPPPELPPAVPYSILSHVQRWKTDREVHERECRVEDLFTRVIAVELHLPLSFALEPNTDEPGVSVTGVVDGTDAAKLGLQEGDSLLAIGSIDLENASMDHVTSILEGWEPDRPVQMLLVQDSD